ncbi:probable RNA-directed DNA polymerase from transposon X-element [Trichonephila clavipes]|nr:probable RNA-directed DNA polymerase from transposon X-element [Trichonephila clavipes]
MANLPTDMELEMASNSQRTLSRTPSPQQQLTPCEQLKFNKAQLAKMEAFRKCKQACVDALKQMPDHYPDEPFYQRALMELQDIQETMAVAVSDIDSYDPCTIPGCPHHEITQPKSPIKQPQNTPINNSLNVNPCKRKENSNFEYPPQRKTARKLNLDFHDNEEINLSPNKFELPKGIKSKILENPGSPAPTLPRTEIENNTANNSTNQSTAQSQLPPPIMLFIQEDVNYKDQMAVITKKFPKIRPRLTGDFLKLYTETAEERRTAVQFLREHKFQFSTIKSKAERPIKVVIKGLPRTTNPEEIKEDLELLGYTPDRVNQLVGRKTKRALPIFLITLPRNLDNLKIFDLKTLSYLSIRVEGYNGKGVTQCYTCNNFNHTSENCFLNPRCLKCGENHITRDCPIKQRLETAYCINCHIYGHMANYKGCPSFPKPPKGTALNNRNSYTNIYNSIVRPNVSYAQAANGSNNSRTNQQMATRGPGFSAQPEAKKPNPSSNRYNNNNFPNFNNRNNNFNLNNFNNNNNLNVQTTLQMTMHCLMQLSQILCNKKHSPDILLIQETHLRPAHNFNIANYTCHRNDRITDGSRSAGGTLILIKSSLKHYCLPTPSLRALEATNIILTPPKHDPISITSVYIPPSSDKNLFTLDIEYFIQTANNCVLFGDFNASHTAWNCNNISNRGRHLYNFANMVNLNIAYPPTPTRFGYNSANTIDIAIIKNFYYPFTINSIDDLSSDHNPVFLNFNFKLAIEPPNPRAVSTDWNAFRFNLNNNLSLFDYHPNSINNTCELENKISEFTEAVIDTHSHASRPIGTDRRNFTPQHINRLLKLKNYLRKQYHQTQNPLFKSQYNRAQSDFKKELKKHNDSIWQKRLESLNTTDNSLWRTQKFFKNKRSKIPPLNCATGTAVTDQQKANLLATNIKYNFIENDRENDIYNQSDEIINSTVHNFLSTPPTTLIQPALPDEIIHYIKHVNAKKAPGKDLITNRMLKNFPIKIILILTILINKILKFNHFPDNWKEAIIFPINKPGKDPHLATSYRPISLLSTISKLTESIILHRLKNFINEHNLLNPNQYGFTNKLSTLHPLLRLTEHISEGFQKRKSTGAVFLDIQKAFDRVWINGLTFKLISYNLPPPLIHLIHSYLTNRSFKIRINETLSNEHSVFAGCPQGSLLGPLLFNLYVNDIPD